MFLDVLSQYGVRNDDPGIGQELTTFRRRCVDLLVCTWGLAASPFLERHMLLSQVMKFALGPPLGHAIVWPCHTYVCMQTCMYGHKLEEEMATHSSILACRILWTEEPGGLLSMGLQSRTWLKRLSMHACTGEGNGNPLQYSCLENPRDGGAWWAAVYGVAQRWTQLKRQQQQQPDNFVFLSSLSWVAWDGFHDYLEGSTRMNWHSSGQCICGRLKNDTPKIIMFLSWNLWICYLMA